MKHIRSLCIVFHLLTPVFSGLSALSTAETGSSGDAIRWRESPFSSPGQVFGCVFVWQDATTTIRPKTLEPLISKTKTWTASARGSSTTTAT
ncbi:hypothetical protein CEXT_671611 [Caerostris extrusa]|uniref:Secreted protein n=1 Tax=Caerostris extrusa TaxID=172846 RepID=A0AAV4S6D0_CAEEX|nr:hypothetical protein CEXT_671611 [Caerostris extrusa]